VAETRATLLRAATALFTTHGWSRTGMRDVAREAGVAVETLYSHYPSKRKLLDAVVDHAVEGDEAEDEPAFASLGRGRRGDRIAAAAALLAASHGRTGGFASLLREAAASDEGIADVLRSIRERQRQEIAAGVELILGRPPTDEERDGVWAIASPEVYLLLVEESGWTPAQYETWIAETLERVVARS
jgi:AcrR family transcriptional regulator